MIYICCDMNCNNFGNYFQIIGHEEQVTPDDSGFKTNGAHYPLKHCYRGKPPCLIGDRFSYSEAIDMLLPEDFRVWKLRRFGFDKYKINQAIESARNHLGMVWDNNRQRLSFYEYVNNFLIGKEEIPHKEMR